MTAGACRQLQLYARVHTLATHAHKPWPYSRSSFTAALALGGSTTSKPCTWPRGSRAPQVQLQGWVQWQAVSTGLLIKREIEIVQRPLASIQQTSLC